MNKRTILLSASVAAALAFGSSASGAGAAGGGADGLAANKAIYEVRTEAGSGQYELKDGAPANAAFRGPVSLLSDTERGGLLVADAGNQRLRLIGGAAVSTAAGIDLGADNYNAPVGALSDGAADVAAFDDPSGLAEDANGVVYIADAGNHAIRSLDAEGNVATVAGDGLIGLKDGKASEARFYRPLDVAVTKEGVVYVADTLNHVIRKIENGVVSTLNAPSARPVEYAPGAVEPAGDYKDGPLAQAKFNEPSGLALDAKGNLYVSDTGNQLIRYIDFAAGTVSTVAGGRDGQAAAYEAGAPYAAGGYADGPAAGARFNAPRGLAITGDGGLLIADSLNHAVRYLQDGQVVTVAGTAGEASRADGVALAAAFDRPTDVAWLGGGSYAVADSGSNRIRIVAPYAPPAGIVAGSETKLLYNTDLLGTDAPPVTVDGSVFVPVRVLTEALGYEVKYEAGAAKLSKGGTTYTLHAGSGEVARSSGGQGEAELELTAPAFSRENRLFLPVRFFAEEIGLDVQWLPDIRAVLIRDKRFP